ncbi:hypothetical protein D9M68_904310 [compost metagenome]
MDASKYPSHLKIKDVVIRWYAKDHPTRPGEIDLLPWRENFENTRVFQRGGPGGFCDYHRHLEINEAEEHFTPRYPGDWLQDVFIDLVAHKGLDARAVMLAFDDLAEFCSDLSGVVEWIPQGGAA